SLGIERSPYRDVGRALNPVPTLGWHLIDGEIELGRRRFTERAGSHVAGDAHHDLVVRRLAVGSPFATGDPFADRILVRKRRAGERFADDHDLERTTAVVVAEASALDDGNAH